MKKHRQTDKKHRRINNTEGFNMGMVRLGALNVTQASYNRAREIVDNKPKGEKKTAEDVLASLRKMKPGWTISTTSADWTKGVRNIEIDYDVLERMAEDPETMVKFKALILDLEDAVPALEEWLKENPGTSMTFAFDIAANGNLKAVALLRTLMGQEVRTAFELYDDKTTWSGMIKQKLDALAQGQVEDAEGNRSWVV
jgi:hypothetical protein